MAKTVDVRLVFYVPLWVGTVMISRTRRSLRHLINNFEIRDIADIAEVKDQCNSFDEVMEKLSNV